MAGNHSEIERIFQQAVEIPSGDRCAYLDANCHDQEIRVEVEKLLLCDQMEGGGLTEILQIGLPENPDSIPRSSPVPEAARRLSHSSSSSNAIDHGQFVAGTVLADRYRIVGLLGIGGMGEVYRADDLELGQSVALKFLPRQFVEDARILQRFRGEVRLARQVSHPNVCRVYDIAQIDGRCFLSMEYVDGEDLSRLLSRIGRFPPDRATALARQLCLGLHAAHERGVLHRDLKPANIMIDGRGKLLITDFGLAEIVDNIRSEDIRSGTPAYMAPEQLAGRDVTKKSDLYSLGIILYELYTGKPVWEANSMAELLEKRKSSPACNESSHLSALDPLIARVIERCLEPDPLKRPNSALEIIASLPGGDPLAVALAAGETPSPELVAAAGKQDAMQPRHAIALAILGVVLFVGVSRWFGTMSMLNYLSLDKPPEVLIDRARGMLHELGFTEPTYSDPVDQAWGFARDQDASRLPETKFRSQPDKVAFWYRQSPTLFIPVPTYLDSFVRKTGSVRLLNPQPTTDGEVTVTLDLAGKLQHFEVAQNRMSTVEAEEPDWNPLFALAGLDQAMFQPDRPRYQRLNATAHRRAWIGSRAEQPDLEIRVEAGTSDGRLSWFDVSSPAITEPTDVAQQAGRRAFLLAFVSSLLVLLVMLVSVRYTIRNLKQGRADLRGALRLATFLAGLSFSGACLRSHTVFSPMWALALWEPLSQAMFVGLLFWSVYIAAEPLGRRVWPQMFISSNRLLSRPRIQWCDPLFGRSVLVGLVLGQTEAVILGPLALTIESWWDGEPRIVPFNFDLLLGQHQAVAGLLNELSFAGWLIFGMMSLVVLRFIVKRTWLAVALNTVLLSIITPTMATSVEIGLSCNMAATIVSMSILLRWGIVAYLVAYVTAALALFGSTADWSAWYSQAANITLAFVIALALYGVWAAIGDRREVAGIAEAL